MYKQKGKFRVRDLKRVLGFSSFLLARSLGNGITRTQWHSDYIIATLSLTPLLQLHYSLYPSSLSILLPSSFSLSCVRSTRGWSIILQRQMTRGVTSGNETRQTCRFPERPLRWIGGGPERKEPNVHSRRWLVRFSRIDWKSETGSWFKLPIVTCAKGGWFPPSGFVCLIVFLKRFFKKDEYSLDDLVRMYYFYEF